MNKLDELRKSCLQENYPIMTLEALEVITSILEKYKTPQVLELGSCVGYSAIYLKDKHPNLLIESIERDMDRHILSKENVKDFQMENSIKMIYDDALTFETDKLYDVIIFDAAKAQNQAFLDRYLPNLKLGGKIIIDNIDFHGYKENITQNDSKGLRSMMRKLNEFEESLKLRSDIKTEYIKVGDGLLILEKLS